MRYDDFIESWRREAMQPGQRKLFLSQLRRRFGDELDGATERRIAAARGEQIEVWAWRVWTAATLAEVLAD